MELEEEVSIRNTDQSIKTYMIILRVCRLSMAVKYRLLLVSYIVDDVPVRQGIKIKKEILPKDKICLLYATNELM